MKWKYICLFIALYAHITTLYADNATSDANTTTPAPYKLNPFFAASGVGPYIETPDYNGSGCPVGTVSTSLSPDQTALSVLFDGYRAEAGAGAGSANGRKNCDIAIPFHVPLGFQVGIVGADYRGFNDLPSGAQSRFTVEYFLAGENTLPFTSVFNGPLASNFLLQDSVHTASVRWSDCSTPVTFRVNTDLVVESNMHNDQAMSTIDSADLTINDPANPNALQFYFLYRPCADHGGGGSST